MLSYKEFYQAVEARVQPGIVFNIEVQTWRHGRGTTETKWRLYIAFSEGSIYEGFTPEEVLSRFDNDLAEGQTLDQTSAAVGSAEVA